MLLYKQVKRDKTKQEIIIMEKRKFEVGKTYTENDVLVFEIVKRTAKFVTYVEIQKYGKYNEIREEPKRTKIHDWDTREVFFASGCLLEA